MVAGTTLDQPQMNKLAMALRTILQEVIMEVTDTTPKVVTTTPPDTNKRPKRKGPKAGQTGRKLAKQVPRDLRDFYDHDPVYGVLAKTLSQAQCLMLGNKLPKEETEKLKPRWRLTQKWARERKREIDEFYWQNKTDDWTEGVKRDSGRAYRQVRPLTKPRVKVEHNWTSKMG